MLHVRCLQGRCLPTYPRLRAPSRLISSSPPLPTPPYKPICNPRCTKNRTAPIQNFQTVKTDSQIAAVAEEEELRRQCRRSTRRLMHGKLLPALLRHPHPSLRKAAMLEQGRGSKQTQNKTRLQRQLESRSRRSKNIPSQEGGSRRLDDRAQ